MGFFTDSFKDHNLSYYRDNLAERLYCAEGSGSISRPLMLWSVSKVFDTAGAFYEPAGSSLQKDIMREQAEIHLMAAQAVGEELKEARIGMQFLPLNIVTSGQFRCDMDEPDMRAAHEALYHICACVGLRQEIGMKQPHERSEKLRSELNVTGTLLMLRAQSPDYYNVFDAQLMY